MGFLSIFLEILGVGIGFPVGLLIGFFFFVYSRPDDNVKDLIIRPFNELDTDALHNLLPEIPLWVKNPDFDRVEWLNRFLLNMWPFLDKVICNNIRSTAESMFAEYIGQYKIETIEFENLTLGTLPPTIQGLKVYETNEKELVLEPAIKWAGNSNIVVAIEFSSIRVRVQLEDLQIFASPRVTLKPLVPTFPCFVNVVVSLMEKPHVDFGLKLLGGDIMAIPGLYQLVQEMETITKQMSKQYHWPQILEIPVLDAKSVAVKKPVGILHVKVVRAVKLIKMDFLGLSDPYVKVSLSGDGLTARKTSIKKKNLNPEWNECFKLTVKDPDSQFLHLDVLDWDKVGAHDRIGTQVYPLKSLQLNETKEVSLELLESSNTSSESQSLQNKKQRGQVVVELMYAPFRDDSDAFNGSLGSFNMSGRSSIDLSSRNLSCRGAGLLMVSVQGAHNVEGHKHNNPYVVIFFKGEKKKSKTIKMTRNPQWGEEFEFMLEKAPVEEKIHVQVMSKRTGFGFRSKESLGHVDISLDDVVNNGHMNEEYHLIDSKNGVIHVEFRWKTI